jgi:CDP-glycerol glycerophosphotransferase (TagB/SpsB family)
VVAFGPDVLVMAGHAGLEYFRHHLPRAFAVNVRHGMIGKRGISRLPDRAAARTFDFVCVGNEDSLAAYEQGGARPREYWRTGYPQIDPLFRRDPSPALPLDAQRPTVLYAPTWNLGLTSATMLGARVVELIRAQAPEVNIIIKPHPVIGDWRPRWMARWARLAAREPGVLLVRDTHADIVPYMLAADLLISDASSAIFEFLALDRPIVLLTNPRHRADPAYAPGSIVWRWRDLGDEVHDVARLPGAVAEALRAPGRHAERRRHYARLLFGELTDGRNHVRVAEKILALPTPAAPRAALAVPAGAPSWTWHDLRSRLSMSLPLRRLLLGPLEAVRLRARGWLIR